MTDMKDIGAVKKSASMDASFTDGIKNCDKNSNKKRYHNVTHLTIFMTQNPTYKNFRRIQKVIEKGFTFADRNIAAGKHARKQESVGLTYNSKKN